MFSARLVGRLARFHGQRSETSSGSPSRREPAVDRPVAGRLGDRADALARDVLDGLAEHAARRAPEPRAAIRGRVDARPRRRARPPRGSRRTPRARRLRAVAAARRARRAARARGRAARGVAGSCDAPRPGAGLSAGVEPARLDLVDVLPLLARLPELVADEVLRLDPRHAPSTTAHSPRRARRPPRPLPRTRRCRARRSRPRPLPSSGPAPRCRACSRPPISSIQSRGTGAPERAGERRRPSTRSSRSRGRS